MTVLIQPPGAVGPASLRRLRVGEALSFGRGAPGRPVDLVLDHPGVSRVAGEIVAGPAFWYLTNASGRHSYLVENAEGAGEFVRAQPGRAGIPIPFEIATLVLPAGHDTLRLQVFAPEQPSLTGAPGGPAGTPTASAFPLDHQAKYFLVLVALCERRLRGEALAGLPSAGRIAERLRPLPGCADLTGRAVDFHIDYLARIKLRLTGADEGVATRREALAGFALRFGLVREADLAQLPPLARRPTLPTGTR